MVFQRWLHPDWRRGFKASHLSYTCQPPAQYQAAVKLHRVFLSCRRSPASSRAPQFHRALRRDNGQVVQPFMRVGTYPTRDFATLGILLLPRYPFPGPEVGRSFLPTSVCRHTDRTISSRTFRQRVRRMVSEDSAEAALTCCDRVLMQGLMQLSVDPLSEVFPADCPHRTHCYLPPYDVRDQ